MLYIALCLIVLLQPIYEWTAMMINPELILQRYYLLISFVKSFINGLITDNFQK